LAVSTVWTIEKYVSSIFVLNLAICRVEEAIIYNQSFKDSFGNLEDKFS
jgi:hypothetical protein